MMERSIAFIQRFPDAKVLGLTNDALSEIAAPTLVVHHGRLEDQQHTMACAEAAVEAIPGAEPLFIDEKPLQPTEGMLGRTYVAHRALILPPTHPPFACA